MNTASQRKTERLAKISRVLGILSFLLILFPLGLRLWTIIKGPLGDWSMLGWAYLAVFMMVGSLLTGIPGLIIALIALNRNKAEGGDQAIKGIANTGLVLSILGILGASVMIISAWIYASNNPPPPAPTTPIPSTAVP